MNQIKVIGIGSPFGNDQLGWWVVDQLKNTMTCHVHGAKELEQKVCFIHSDRPGIRLLELLKDTDVAILVDAIDNKEYSGQILQLDRQQLIGTNHVMSSHAFGVSEALALAHALDDLPREIVLFGIAVDSHDPLPITREIIAKLCDRINHYIEQTRTMH